jgi:ankyrin repeat protein
MGFWQKVREGLSGPKPAGVAGLPKPAPPPPWLGAGEPGNPFDVPVLSLMQNLQYTSFSKDPTEAACATSWRAGQHDRFVWDLRGEHLDCDLEYAIEEPLPDGLLFIPAAMEDKWVIAWKQGRIAIARSWSGDTVAVADTRHEANKVRVTRLTFAAESGSVLTAFGDAVPTFHWMMVSHALEKRVPFPTTAAGAALLEGAPLAAMSIFGHRLFCAAVDHALPMPVEPLRSDGELVAAIARDDIARVRALLDGGHSMTVRARSGHPPLHLAVAMKKPELVALLLARGTDPNQEGDRKSKPLTLAVVVGCDDALLQQLVDAGADLECKDLNGFRPLHAAAEANKPAAVRFLHAHHVDFEARTVNDLTPFHIACALGNLDAARELARLGADVRAASPLGTALDIARREGKDDLVRWLGK